MSPRSAVHGTFTLERTYSAPRERVFHAWSDTKAKALVKSLRDAKLVEHAAKDLFRAAHLPLLPSDESHVDADLKRIHKG